MILIGNQNGILMKLGNNFTRHYLITHTNRMNLIYIVKIIFCFIASLGPGATIAVTLGIDFKDTTQSAGFNLW